MPFWRSSRRLRCRGPCAGGVETHLIEQHPVGGKPSGGAIPLCMLSEFSLPPEIVDRNVRRMKIVSPSNLTVDFGQTLKPHEYIPMLRRKVLDSFLRSRAESNGTDLIDGLFTGLEAPVTDRDPYVVHYTESAGEGLVVGIRRSMEVDVVVGANSRVAKAIGAGNYTSAIAFQELIRLSGEKMEYYQNLTEMYVGSDVSPDFYGWGFPKCDHVAVGTGTVFWKAEIKKYQAGIRMVKVEAHPNPEHPRPRRIVGREVKRLKLAHDGAHPNSTIPTRDNVARA